MIHISIINIQYPMPEKRIVIRKTLMNDARIFNQIVDLEPMRATSVPKEIWNKSYRSLPSLMIQEWQRAISNPLYGRTYRTESDQHQYYFIRLK